MALSGSEFRSLSEFDREILKGCPVPAETRPAEMAERKPAVAQKTGRGHKLTGRGGKWDYHREGRHFDVVAEQFRERE